MRRLLGLLVLLYGLLLALNTAAPSLAKLVGNAVAASISGSSAGCTERLGTPPYGGLYGNCPASWEGTGDGRVFGDDVSGRFAMEGEVKAYEYPLLKNFAVLAPSESDQVTAIISVLIIIVGVGMAQKEKKRTSSHSDDDGSDTDTDTDSDSGGDGGGDGGGD